MRININKKFQETGWDQRGIEYRKRKTTQESSLSSPSFRDRWEGASKLDHESDQFFRSYWLGTEEEDKELTVVFTNVKVIGNLQEQCPGRCGGIKVDQSAFNQEW